MVQLDWSNAFRAYEAGVDRGVLYFGSEAVPWDGLVSVKEQPALKDATPAYFEGTIFNFDQELGDYQATVEAFVYPYFLEDSVLAMSDGRTLINTVDEDSPFGFSYRVNSNEGYKIHLIYNIVATIETVEHATIDDGMDLSPFEFTFYTTPVDIPGGRPSAHLVIETADAPIEAVQQVEDILYGTELYSPRMPTVSELVEIFNSVEGASS